MVRQGVAVSVAMMLFGAAFGQAAEQKDMAAMRSGQVLICRVDKGCIQEEEGGRKVFSMEADGYVVRASIGFDQDLSHAEISIKNGTASPVTVRAADFRMEATEPRLVRLPYVDKAHGPVARVKTVRSHGLPDPSYWGSAKQQQAMQEQAAEARLSGAGAGLLRSGPVAPGETAEGLVYFQLPKHATSISLVLPISGALFEFPSEPPVAQGKGHKTKKLGV